MLKRCLFVSLVLASSVALADERGAERAFACAKRTEPELLAFLKRMPKGGDLHNHVSGASYSDYMLDAAIASGLFFDPASSSFGTDATKVPAKNLLTDNNLLYNFLNAASMRGWRGGGQSGHDHFFATFGIFGAAVNAIPDEKLFAEVIGRAKAQNTQYMELMAGPIAWSAFGPYMQNLPSSDNMATALEALRPRFAALVPDTKAYLDARDRAANLIGQRSYTGADEPITVRWIHSLNRLASNDAFFASAAAAMYLMSYEPRIVGINMVAPEDHPLSRANFTRQMEMLDFLWRNLGRPNMTLHAGELTPAISPPESMRDRIRKTIEVGHARRIGHGVSIAWEDNLEDLLGKMKRDGIAVEICLTSNHSILGVDGDRHPLRLYRKAGVPVFLNTDDEGVSRSTLTLEWVRAVREQGMGYQDLKEMARNALEYSFLPGASLYENRDYRHLAAPFRNVRRPNWRPTLEAQKALAASEKARVQLRLERAFEEFERGY